VAVTARPGLFVLRALGLGDLLTAVPVLRALARAFPAHRRVLATPAPLAPLARLAGWSVEPVGELEPLPASLHDFDVGVNIHGRGPQSHRLLIAARPRRTIWFEHAEIAESRGAPAWRAGEHEVSRWCRLLRESGIPASSSELRLGPPAREPAAGSAGATIVHPGAKSRARRWPAERYAAVARVERESGRAVVVTGSGGEAHLAQEVAQRASLPPESVLAGRTDLMALAATVARAGRVVCGDTGVAHLATAFGTPSVVLFGPTSPAGWGPPPGSPRHRVLWSGSVGDPHADRPDPGLLEIGVPEVLAALDTLPGPLWGRRAPQPAGSEGVAWSRR
jgi:ADP-heptose:LPS heptosyltransferase